MSLSIKPFQAIGPTIIKTVTNVATTVTLGPSTTGLPLESVRLFNAGTVAVFLQFISTANTVTVGVTNSQILPTSVATILGTGGQPAIGILAGSTFTTTCYITGGIGGGGA